MKRAHPFHCRDFYIRRRVHATKGTSHNRGWCGRARLRGKPSKAALVEFDFGNNPSTAPSGCNVTTGQPGAVCGNTLTFDGTSAGLGTLTAQSSNGAPGSVSG